MQKTVDQQSGPDEEHEGNGHFADHQQAPDAISFGATSGVASAFLQRVVQIEVRPLNRGDGSERDSSQHGHETGNKEHSAVDWTRSRLANADGNEGLQNPNPG